MNFKYILIAVIVIASCVGLGVLFSNRAEFSSYRQFHLRDARFELTTEESIDGRRVMIPQRILNDLVHERFQKFVYNKGSVSIEFCREEHLGMYIVRAVEFAHSYERYYDLDGYEFYDEDKGDQPVNRWRNLPFTPFMHPYDPKPKKGCTELHKWEAEKAEEPATS